MEEWLQSLAVGVAVLIGLVSPAVHLTMEASMLKSPQSVLVQGRVEGALTPQAREYLLAGNSLTLIWQIQWGDTEATRTRTITYHAWDSVFEVSDSDAAASRESADEAAALQDWQTLPPGVLGSRQELAGDLGTPLRVRVSLSGPLEALWGYKTLETSLLYRTWLEVPQ